MTNEDLLAIFLIICTFLAGLFLGVGIVGSYAKGVIVEKGYGLYCPDTGNFAFKGECNNE